MEISAQVLGIDAKRDFKLLFIPILAREDREEGEAVGSFFAGGGKRPYSRARLSDVELAPAGLNTAKVDSPGTGQRPRSTHNSGAEVHAMHISSMHISDTSDTVSGMHPEAPHYFILHILYDVIDIGFVLSGFRACE
jgi:hypothetical protein